MEGTKEASVPEDLGTQSTSSDSREAYLRILKDKPEFFVAKDYEMIDRTRRSTRNLRNLIRSSFNLLSVTATSVGEEVYSAEVEIDIDSSFTSEGSSPIKSEQDSGPIVVHETISTVRPKRKSRSPAISPSKRIKSEHSSSIANEDAGPILVQEAISPVKPERKNRSTAGSPSISIKSEPGSSIAGEPLPSIDYSNPNILNFHTKRLLSILTWRKTCMEEMHNFFKMLESKLGVLASCLVIIKFVLPFVPDSYELNLADEYSKLYVDMKEKITETIEGALKLKNEFKSDAKVFADCVEEISTFESKHSKLLSAEGESKPTVSDIKIIEVGLKEICKKADGIVILEEGRKQSLSKLSIDFDWLVPEYVKFLIIHRILQPL